ncbi:MAG: hypothetical protein KME45_30800 [Stenomitos rutilans HA7619-LM2]|nr:hypothetical protein [Stenomitos rutilans HA7619-LM2]
MQHEDLKFWTEGKGGKPHFIFRQGRIFYILTCQKDGIRGNFMAISQGEVDRVRRQLAAASIPSLFDCKKIYKSIQGIDMQLDRNQPSYYIQRLRNICYIMVADKFLEIEKDGNLILFQKRPSLVALKNESNTKVTLKSDQMLCPYCKCPIGIKKIESHKKTKCPKRPGV